jgi:SRSO17 transposase
LDSHAAELAILYAAYKPERNLKEFQKVQPFSFQSKDFINKT